MSLHKRQSRLKDPKISTAPPPSCPILSSLWASTWTPLALLMMSTDVNLLSLYSEAGLLLGGAHGATASPISPRTSPSPPFVTRWRRPLGMLTTWIGYAAALPA